jgi:tetratricopeptide (TPR) repeat protein
MGRYYTAIESYEMALTINGKFGSAWYNKGNAYASLGIITRAIECYKQAIYFNRKDSYALYNLASAYEQIGLNKEAIDHFSKVLQLDPSHYESFFGRGNCYYQLEDYKHALKDYNSALSLYDDNSELWYAKADAEYNLGLVVESINSYLRVIEIDPSNFNAMLDLCNTMIENEEYDRADEYLKRLLRVKPDWSEPYYSMAKVCFLKGSIDIGIAMIERAFELNPEERFPYDFEKDWRKILHFLITRQSL